LVVDTAGACLHIAAGTGDCRDGAGRRGSILDASGYVVAPPATVASKITAKMVELDIEEGDHVNAGQIIAKLDVQYPRSVNQASAQLEYAKALSPRRRSISQCPARLRRQKSLLQGHFVSQSAWTMRRPPDALRAQLHPAQQRRCRRAALGVRQVSGRYHRACAFSDRQRQPRNR